MKIAVLGTGMVGNAIATKLINVGHQITMGSRTANSDAGQEEVVCGLSPENGLPATGRPNALMTGSGPYTQGLNIIRSWFGIRGELI